MRRILHALLAVAVFAALGWNVWRSEALIAAGDEVLLALAPVDPRSLMQGDYMRLRFDIERTSTDLSGAERTIVLALDTARIGRFARHASEGAPGPGEIAFQVARARGGGLSIEPHSFLFQEGTADAYAKAKYGIFRVAPDGRHLLVGLADENARRIEPPAPTTPAPTTPTR